MSAKSGRFAIKCALDKLPPIFYNIVMSRKSLQTALKILTGAILLIALALTFTLSDYYVFNRFYMIDEFNPAFIISQWIKKAGLLLLPLAVYLDKRSCADICKYILPIFVIISFYPGGYFNATKPTYGSEVQEIYNQINLFMPKWLNMLLFYLQNDLMLIACALLFFRDGYKVRARSFIYLPLAVFGVMPLNIFENFFDISTIPADSLLRFNSFTVWHAVAILILIGFTVGCYYFLKRFDMKKRWEWLVAAAIVMLIQYHSKDSMVIGDGYNVYHTVFACIPLFICNIGVYVAALAIFTRKKVLYATAFFVHAAGALTVFVYFGKPEMSNYGIFCSYSILYFCLTHCLLFSLSVMPAALGFYKFRWKDCIVPLIYYFAVIVLASVASALVTSASYDFHVGDYYLSGDDILMPNYAFTQINPLPFELPLVPLRIWRYDLSVIYVVGLYFAYVAIFFVWIGFYYAFLAIRKSILERKKPREST